MLTGIGASLLIGNGSSPAILLGTLRMPRMLLLQLWLLLLLLALLLPMLLLVLLLLLLLLLLMLLLMFLLLLLLLMLLGVAGHLPQRISVQAN